MQKNVLNWVTSHGKSKPKEIAESLKLRAPSVRRALQQLQDKGFIKSSEGTYEAIKPQRLETKVQVLQPPALKEVQGDPEKEEHVTNEKEGTTEMPTVLIQDAREEGSNPLHRSGGEASEEVITETVEHKEKLNEEPVQTPTVTEVAPPPPEVISSPISSPVQEVVLPRVKISPPPRPTLRPPKGPVGIPGLSLKSVRYDIKDEGSGFYRLTPTLMGFKPGFVLVTKSESVRCGTCLSLSCEHTRAIDKAISIMHMLQKMREEKARRKTAQ